MSQFFFCFSLFGSEKNYSYDRIHQYQHQNMYSHGYVNHNSLGNSNRYYVGANHGRMYTGDNHFRNSFNADHNNIIRFNAICFVVEQNDLDEIQRFAHSHAIYIDKVERNLNHHIHY